MAAPIVDAVTASRFLRDHAVAGVPTRAARPPTRAAAGRSTCRGGANVPRCATGSAGRGVHNTLDRRLRITRRSRARFEAGSDSEWVVASGCGSNVRRRP